MSDDMVWVDDGTGPIKAICGEPGKQIKFIREPVQKKKSDVIIGDIVLDAKMLAYYRDAIRHVEERRKKKSP